MCAPHVEPSLLHRKPVVHQLYRRCFYTSSSALLYYERPRNTAKQRTLVPCNSAALASPCITDQPRPAAHGRTHDRDVGERSFSSGNSSKSGGEDARQQRSAIIASTGGKAVQQEVFKRVNEQSQSWQNDENCARSLPLNKSSMTGTSGSKFGKHVSECRQGPSATSDVASTTSTSSDLSVDARYEGVRINSVDSLYTYLRSRPMSSVERPLVIFKGGGYVYEDLKALLRTCGLRHIMHVTNKIAEADCVVCKAQWETGRRVNLKEHKRAALQRDIPFIVIEHLKARALLVKLWPLFIRKGIIPQPHVRLRSITLTRKQVLSEVQEKRGVAAIPDGSGPKVHRNNTSQRTELPSAEEIRMLQEMVMRKEMSVSQYIRKLMIQGHSKI